MATYTMVTIFFIILPILLIMLGKLIKMPFFIVMGGIAAVIVAFTFGLPVWASFVFIAIGVIVVIMEAL